MAVDNSTEQLAEKISVSPEKVSEVLARNIATSINKKTEGEGIDPEALADILAPAGLTPALLKAEGHYVEDTY